MASGVQKTETSQTIFWGGGENKTVGLILTSRSTEQAAHRNMTSTYDLHNTWTVQCSTPPQQIISLLLQNI